MSERAWAAGLFEGEGCFSTSNGARARGGRYLNRTAKLNMTDEEPVRRFHAIMGVGTVRLVDTEYKPQWCWQVSSFEGVQHVVATLWSELGRRRRDQARTVLGH
jgi:hypothetical protein